MGYFAAVIGFCIGFALGQALLVVWLKDRSTREILNNRDLKWRYGLFNWGLAFFGGYLGATFYRLILAAPPILP